jgi:hypothetical protein
MKTGWGLMDVTDETNHAVNFDDLHQNSRGK